MRVLLLLALVYRINAQCVCTPFSTISTGSNQLILSCLPAGTCNSTLSSLPNGLAQNWVNPQTCPVGKYLSGSGKNCQTDSVDGQSFQYNCDPGVCNTCSCAVRGTYVSTCASTSTIYNEVNAPNFACSPCTNKPSLSVYTGNSSSILTSRCSWQCPSGYYYSYPGSTCIPCKTVCSPGQQIVTACANRVNTLMNAANDTNAICGACTNSLNVVSYTSGCTIGKCKDGFVISGNTCSAPPPVPPSPPVPPPPPSPPPPDHDTGLSCGPAVSVIGVTGVSYATGTTSTLLFNKGTYGTQSNCILTGGRVNATAQLVYMPPSSSILAVPFAYSGDYFSLVMRFTVLSLPSTVAQNTLNNMGVYLIVESTQVYVFVNALTKWYFAQLRNLPAVGSLISVHMTCAQSMLFCFGSYLV